ncbi:MAG: DUF6538 domain-containing protein [Halioglobus sp.]
MPKNMLLRGNVWQANLQIPQDVRGVLKRSKFKASCGTGELATAEPIAMKFIAGWKQQIAAARQDPDAAALAIYTSGLENKAAIEAGDYADEATGTTHIEAWLDDFLDTQPESKHSYYRKVFQGKTGLPLLAFSQQWIEDEYDKPRTRLEASNSINKLLPHMPTLTDISQTNAQRWVNSETRAKKTVMKTSSFMSSYYRWLVANEKIVRTFNPFIPENLSYPKRLTPTESYAAFTDGEMTAVLKLLEDSGDEELLRIFNISRYTGMRLAECCRVAYEKREGVDGLVLTEGKTEAAVRWVPIAPSLELPDTLPLANNTAVGKRFGRLLRKHFDNKNKVFHSVRKWVGTKLRQDSSIPDRIATELFGHSAKLLIDDVYSDGASVEQLVAAVATLEKANKALE